MPRYIDADAANEKIDNVQNSLESNDDKVWYKNKPYYKGLAMARGVIDETPTADVVPRAEVERLEQILNSYALQYGTVKDQQEVIDKIKRETAREIFAEIRKIVTAIYNKHIFGSDLEDEEKEAVMDFEVDISSAFDELEEEYGITDNAPKE